MPNRGVSPIDVNASTGQLRLLVGDSDGIPLEPVETGWLDYNVFSDATLDAALLNSGANLLRAAGNLYLQLAAAYAMSSREVTTDDLRLSTKGRGKDLRDIAQSFFDQAASADAVSSADFFQIVPFGGRTSRAFPPEATPWPNPEPTPIADYSPLDGGSA